MLDYVLAFLGLYSAVFYLLLFLSQTERVRKDPSKCTHCRVCYRVCPMEILKVYEERKNTDVSSAKCVHCYNCVDNCPEEGCLHVEHAL